MLGICRRIFGFEWVPVFSTWIEIMKEDLPELLDELNQLKQWALLGEVYAAEISEVYVSNLRFGE
jgi:hypothetical protein